MDLHVSYAKQKLTTLSKDWAVCWCGVSFKLYDTTHVLENTAKHTTKPLL